MADIFVSYARFDKARVAPIVAALEAQGWSAWWDPAIAPGDEFDRLIADELRRCRIVIVVWTPASVESRWVRGEARDGADRGILVPLRFDQATLPIDTRALHTIDLDAWDGTPDSPLLQPLLQAIGSRLGSTRSLQTPAPVAWSPTGRAGASICVLPFVNMSGDPEQEYFSDGICEDVITDLSKVSSLFVIARNTSFTYKGRHVDVPQLAQRLNVSHVLEGSVRKAGGRVRITAQLVDGSINDHIWAERYDRDLNDIFSLQDEISAAIVKALKLKLLPEERKAIEQRGTDNVEAYNLYLMARHLYVTGYESDPRRAEAIIRMCVRATEIDPGYARGWALIAVGQMNLRFAQGGGDGGMAAAERALALDADLAEAHAVKARILADIGRHDEASAEIDVALGLDADSYEVNRSAGYLSYRKHRLEDAIRFWEKASTLLDTDINSSGMLISCYWAVGNAEGKLRAARLSLARAEKVLAQDPNNAMVIAYSVYALGALGDAERATERMKRALLIDPDNWNMRYNFACVLITGLNEIDAALDMLAPEIERATIGRLNHVKVDPDFADVRDHPRFKAMIAAAEARLVTESHGGTPPSH